MKPQYKVFGALAIAGALTIAGALRFNAAPASSDIAASQPSAAPTPALTVTAETPRSEQWPRTLPANGTVAAWQEASIGAEVSNLRLSEIRVNVGDAVTRGQVLAVLASETAAAELTQARASVTAAQAQLAEAASNADGARRLRGTGALSEQQIIQLLTAEQTAQAQLQVQIATAEVASLRLRQTRVVAPDDGVISARTASTGTVVSSTQELFRLIRQSRLEWRAEVTSHELARLRVGSSARVQAPDGEVVTGTVRMVAPSVDPQTRVGLIYVDLPASPSLKAGMFATGEFVLDSSEALSVPRQAIVLRDGFSYVFSLGKDDRVSQVKVTTGRRRGERVELIGMQPDVLLIASGVGFLTHGDIVRVVGGEHLLAGS